MVHVAMERMPPMRNTLSQSGVPLSDKILEHVLVLVIDLSTRLGTSNSILDNFLFP